jgi:hypothetical protein
MSYPAAICKDAKQCLNRSFTSGNILMLQGMGRFNFDQNALTSGLRFILIIQHSEQCSWCAVGSRTELIERTSSKFGLKGVGFSAVTSSGLAD